MKERDLPAHVLAAIRERGIVGPPTVTVIAPPEKLRKLPKTTITPGVADDSPGRLVIYVAIETKSETNERSWKAKNRRAGAAWKAVRNALGSQLHLLDQFTDAIAHGIPLRVTLTRLGGRKLDGMANLGAALKGCEDSIAYLIGCDDGSPLWQAVAKQQTDGNKGVKIEIEINA